MNISHDLSQPVVDDGCFYKVMAQVKPGFDIRSTDRSVGVEKFEGHRVFQAGNHYYITHTHVECFENVSTLEEADKILVKLEWDIQYYGFVLGKLTFDVHQHAIQILTHHISEDKVRIERLKEKREEMKHFARLTK